MVELQAELTQLRERIGHYPEHLADQLHAARSARAEAQRVADEARARIAELERPARGVLRRRAADSAERALERQRLKLTEGEIAAAAERERNLASSVPDRAAWEAERRALRERAAELNAQLSTRRREHLRVALERPAPYLTEALGALPDQPRARRTWQQAATRIEAYRFDHTVTDTRHALGIAPERQAASARTGNAPTTTSNALNETSGIATPASTPTRSEAHIQEPPVAALRFVLSRHVVSLNRDASFHAAAAVANRQAFPVGLSRGVPGSSR